jgi:hypothetical protein
VAAKHDEQGYRSMFLISAIARMDELGMDVPNASIIAALERHVGERTVVLHYSNAVTTLELKFGRLVKKKVGVGLPPSECQWATQTQLLQHMVPCVVAMGTSGVGLC